ncbi:hypothetical protein PFISCL1PPCAC_21229, partial [Pristionchus fissidentatus]
SSSLFVMSLKRAASDYEDSHKTGFIRWEIGIPETEETTEHSRSTSVGGVKWRLQLTEYCSADSSKSLFISLCCPKNLSTMWSISASSEFKLINHAGKGDYVVP